MKISANRIIFSVGFFIAITLLLNNLPEDDLELVVPIVMVGVFIQFAIKAPPFAIAILLYYAMVLGSWFILAAAPVTVLLARRYQRKRLMLDLNPDHIRRTVLLAMIALVATLPFTGASLGAWSSRSQSSPTRSADPLIGGARPGEEGALQRFARWLGFGSDGPELGQFDPLRPTPRPVPQAPDDPFNWWLLAAVVAVIALLTLAWWLWRRRTPRTAPIAAPVTARPLARLEAIGAGIGRPRAPFEGAITYGRELARQTGDTRLGEAGPLVSSQVYQSALVNRGVVDNSLGGIEASPPPALPQPSLGERVAARVSRLRLTPKGLAYAALTVLVITLAGWLIVPKLGDLDGDGFESGLEQPGALPFIAEHIDDL